MQAMVLEDTDWNEDALATIIALSHAQSLVTADDLAREMRRPPHPNMTGAAFSAARTLGYIEAAGYTTSNTPSRHHGVIRVWQAKAPAKPEKGSLREGFTEWEYKPEHFGHAEGEWFYACEACSGLPNDRNEIAP